MVEVMKEISVLEVAEHTFVPLASAILAAWGAEVIKIEHVERGDATRGLAQAGCVDVGGGGVDVLMEHANRGKRSIAMDLATPEGRELLYRLAARSDIFLTNKLPAVRSKLKLDVEDIRGHDPSIVYAQGTGYGSKGPDVDLGGYDMLAYWARSGIAVSAKTPEIDYLPPQPVPAFGDSVGAMFVAGGIGTALLHQERTGEALSVDVSLLATGMWAMSAAIGISGRTGKPYRPQPGDSASGNPLVGSYRTADDRWVTLCMLQGFHYWPEVCRVLGHPEWTEDSRFATRESLFQNYQAAVELIAGVMGTATQAEWKARLRGLKGQWSPVQDSVDVVDDPMLAANDYVTETRTQDGVSFRLVTAPVQFDGQASPPRRAPGFNEHGDDILGRPLGLDTGTILDLKRKGVVA
ncbi:CaiB/BaiF CoA transferase family protein [Streptomyces sp. NPDC020792]|uniref:CaiB/BaiF CoA transferase family protein n=1 Tax=Streptomyces sp. NPDC020792 TaxID=3365089 RepID=UPI0037AC63A7